MVRESHLITLAIFLALLLNMLTGCTSQPVTAEEIMETYRKILRNETEFCEVARHKFLSNGVVQEDWYTLDSYYSDVFEETIVVGVDYHPEFTVVNMDCDSVPEVILYSPSNGIMLILRYEKGVVYSGFFSDRTISILKTDGTFEWADGICHYGYGKLEFTGKTYEVIHLAEYDESNYPDPLEAYVDGESVSEEEFLAFCDAQDDKEDVVWHELTDENIEKFVR